MTGTIAKPFLKWAGGKTQLIAQIKSHLPTQIIGEKFTYIEPFVGGGAVLFWMLEQFPEMEKAVINDINKDLSDCYRSIKYDVENLISILSTWQNEYCSLTENKDEQKEYYYSKRVLFNTGSTDLTTRSALLIFLNRTCFNGLFRVNRKNEFNVPMGSYKKPLICNHKNLRAVSAVLQKVEILDGDYTKTLDYANKNTFFYFDPPYKPLSKTSSFNSYAKNSFDDHEQKRLRDFCAKIDSMNHRWILSNSDVKEVDENNHFFDDLYREFLITRVDARRNINANPEKRGKLKELLITNA